MKISILTVFPELHTPFLSTSLIARAQQRGVVSFNLFSFSDFCEPKERIDEPICGAGPGMVLKPLVVERAIEHIEQQHGSAHRIFFSPQGVPLNQRLLRSLKDMWAPEVASSAAESNSSSTTDTASADTHPHLLLICSRYEGMDARVEKHYAHDIISIGDYVLMGGDVAAQVFLEGLLRLFPTVVGNDESIEHESFETPFLDYPTYGLPVIWKDQEIPAVVLSGNHGAVDLWRKKEAAKNTVFKRFDWFRSRRPSVDALKLVSTVVPPHYLALMHCDVLVKAAGPGITSVGSINLHDICRAAATYGIKKVFVVTPMEDQHAVMQTFLQFWRTESGEKYNRQRSNALQLLQPVRSFDEMHAWIAQHENQAPLIVTTSAKQYPSAQTIDYTAQGEVWQHQKPVLFLFGTGQGLAPHMMEKSDYVLLPVTGMTPFNHLSVRSAVAIILDRWLGLQPVLEPKKRGKS